MIYFSYQYQSFAQRKRPFIRIIEVSFAISQMALFYFRFPPAACRLKYIQLLLQAESCRKELSMIKMIITGAVVSKGANDGPAIKFSEKGGFARFRIGYKIYDTRAENNHRWINLTVKAFGDLCDRISKMDLKAG